MTGWRADVGIVGGGLMGAWTAYFLARRRIRVIILEKGLMGAEASGVNFGNLRLQGRHAGQYPLALRSHALWEQLEALVGEHCDFAATGHLYVASEGDEHERLEQYAKDAEEHGVVVERLSAEEVRHRWPWFGGGIISATFSARDATANPRLVVPAVIRAGQRLGVCVLQNTHVVDARAEDEGFTIDTDTGGRVTCAALVNTAGAWSLGIAERFGETAPMFAAGPPQLLTEPLPYAIVPSVQAVSGSLIFRQVPSGKVIMAGYPRTPMNPGSNRVPVPRAKLLRMLDGLAQMVPMFGRAHVIRAWSGIEGYCRDMLPVIGASETTPGLFHAFGFSGHGFQLGPGVGAVLSEMIVDGATSTPVAPFSIGRFRSDVAVSDKIAREFDIAEPWS